MIKNILNLYKLHMHYYGMNLTKEDLEFIDEKIENEFTIYPNKISTTSMLVKAIKIAENKEKTDILIFKSNLKLLIHSDVFKELIKRTDCICCVTHCNIAYIEFKNGSRIRVYNLKLGNDIRGLKTNYVFCNEYKDEFYEQFRYLVTLEHGKIVVAEKK